MVELLVRFPGLGLTQETRVYESDPGRFNRKEDTPQCKRHHFMAWGHQLNKKKMAEFCPSSSASGLHHSVTKCPHTPTTMPSEWPLKQ